MNSQIFTTQSVPREYFWAFFIVLIAAVISLVVSAQVGFFVLLFSVLGWWTWKNSEHGFLLLLLLLPLLPMFKITQTLGTFSLIKDVLILTLFLRTFAVPLLTKKLEYRRNILIAPLVALVVWAVISALHANSLILGVLRLRDIVLYMLLYVAVLYLPHSREIMKRRLEWLLYSFGTALFMAGWQWFFAQDSAVLRFDPARSIWIPRLSGTLAHPSIFGEYVVAIQMLLISLILFVRNFQWKLIYTGLLLVSLPAMFLTYSRAVWLGFIAGTGLIVIGYLLYLATQRISKTKLASITVGGGIALFLLLIPILAFTPAGGLVRSIVDPTYGSNEERLEFFVRLIAPITSSQAIVGLGLGDVVEQNFRETDIEAYDLATGSSRQIQVAKDTTLVDNQYLKTFIEMGVIGLVLYGWVYWRLISHAIKNLLSKISDTENFIIPVWALGFLGAFILQAFFIDIWDIFPSNALFWIVAALLSQSVNKNSFSV